MSAPKRIQRKRTKGWRMPEGAVYVGRPSKWGNPFVVGATLWFPYDALAPVVHDRAHAVDLYRAHAHINVALAFLIPRELAGKDLACWCPLDQPCHADVLLEIANADQKERP